jgi:hypothetical protein
VTFFDNKPLNITNTFPVNNSAPVKMTMVKPKGNPNAPLTRFESPGFEAANAGDEPPTVVKNNPPKPMSAPAVKLNANVDKVSALAFFSDVATAAANVSGGVFASDARTMSRLPLLFPTDDGDVIIALSLLGIARRLMNTFLDDEEEIDRFAENDTFALLLSREEDDDEEEEEETRAEKTPAAKAMVVLVLANIFVCYRSIYKRIYTCIIKNKFSLKMHEEEEEEEKKVSTKRLLVEISASFGRHRERERGCSQNNPRDFF